ncbi:fused MFS/spermidine synthase [Archangium violaceum]|uniref:fused MFS/spermidine synthase n=1 Tax=Archangium violaceum TaxID=83451 RepID=UPI00194E004A|nr:fused MFS/spermidine synthase [Archangium violaceum]QRN97245.1 fused MFS/spermidine synthase [Archangium violaceum]
MNARVWKVAPLLFGSGFCALVYQTAWQRELRLIFGASTAASAAVLAIFMGGLGLGGALLGARADRARQPLGLYANLELLVSLSAALTPLLIGMARLVYVALGGTMSLGLVAGSAVRLVLSALVLAVPTLLMGGTLPAAARAAESAEDVRRRALAVLYGVNTLGAVAGATASTFFLFEVFGTRTTLWLACLLNVVVAVVARGVARGLPEHEPSAAPAASEGGATPAAPRLFVLGAAALVGFAFFLMELVWYRLLGPLLGGSTFTFGLILVVALVGIGLGGAAYAVWGQQRPATLRGFALTCLLEALFIAVPLALGDRLAVLAMVLRPLSSFGFGGLVLSWAVVAALVVLPAAFVSGVQFPLLLALLGRGGEDVGRQVGQAYAWNTVGSIIGSLAGGFGLLPLLSAPGTWRLVGVILVGLGLAAVVLSLRQERLAPLGLVPALGSAVLTAGLLTATGPTATWRHNPIGAGRAQLQDVSVNGLREWRSLIRRWLVWEADGVESSVGISSSSGLSFLVNGKSDGSAVGDAGTQVMGGLIGALLHPRPRHALVIGLGTGSTAGWLGAVPEMERVDVVEIEPAILEMARRCSDVNERVLDNPRVRLHIDDAREVLLATGDSYDIIFSEPSNPYRAGISSLFTREFYQSVRRRLAPGGLFLQWLQAYEVDARTVRSVYATLAAEFPAVETWQTQQGDLILVGSEAPLRHDVERLRARLGQEPYRRALAFTWHTDELEGVLSHFMGGSRLTAAMADGQEALVNTDDLSYLEFAFARSVGRAQTGFSFPQLWEASFRMKGDRPDVVGGPVDWERVAQNRIYQGSPPPPGGESPASRQRRAFLGAYAREDGAQALRLWREAEWQPRGVLELSLVAHVLAEAGDEAALPFIEQLRPILPTDAGLTLGLLRLRQGRLPETTEAFEGAFGLLRQAPWVNRLLMQDALLGCLRVASKDAALGRRLFEALEQPFSTSVWQTLRMERRLMLAERLDFKGLCARALAPFEPHVPWTRKFLEVRARCYDATGNALAAQARADLETFLDAEPPSLWEEEPDAPRGAPGPEHEMAPPVSGVGAP